MFLGRGQQLPHNLLHTLGSLSLDVHAIWYLTSPRRIPAKLVKPIVDDILVYGSGDTLEETIQDHDVKLRTLLQHCWEQGIKLNEEKLKLHLPEVVFMGHIMRAEGLKPGPTKVKAIKKMPTPTCKQDVNRLLGMINYLQKAGHVQRRSYV